MENGSFWSGDVYTNRNNKTGHFAGDFRMEWNKLTEIETRKNNQSEMKLPLREEETNEIVL